ncbi:MAG: YitT family protein [Christensenellales bacterium]|jgi:uncharacterized membrane-anchored protein YitT (DUF2179 family)
MNIKKQAGDYLLMLLGAVLSAVALNLLLIPNNVAPGGFSGIAAVLHIKIGVPFGLSLLVLNLPLFIMAWRYVGRGYFIKSIFGLAAYSLATDNLIMPELAVDPLLATIFGGVLLGAGMGLILRGGGSTGGTDIAALLLRLRMKSELSLGNFILIIDTIVVVGSGVFLGPEEALYALVTVFVCAKVIDLILAPARSRAFFIITDEAEIIKECIMNEIKRGVTELSGKGGYSGGEKSVLLCVVEGNSQFTALKDIIKRNDPLAFMIAVEAGEVLGRGFSG